MKTVLSALAVCFSSSWLLIVWNLLSYFKLISTFTNGYTNFDFGFEFFETETSTSKYFKLKYLTPLFILCNFYSRVVEMTDSSYILRQRARRSPSTRWFPCPGCWGWSARSWTCGCITTFPPFRGSLRSNLATASFTSLASFWLDFPPLIWIVVLVIKGIYWLILYIL